MLAKPISTRPGYPFYQEYRWTDYYELVTLLDSDGLLTLSDMKDQHNNELIEAIGLSYEEPVALVSSNSRFELARENIFNNLKARSHVYKELYPFRINSSTLEKVANLNAGHYTYIYLLMCSCLDYFNRETRSILTSDFEWFCEEAFRYSRPISHGPFVFGKNPSGSDSYFSGNAFTRVSKLAEMMRCSLKVKESDFSISSSGDEGIDIVGWHNPWDVNNSQFVYAGNCKCSEDWEQVRDPSVRLKSLLELNNGALSVFFIPYHYRSLSGGWFKAQSVRGRMLYDRIRLIRSAPSEYIESRPSMVIIKRFLANE